MGGVEPVGGPFQMGGGRAHRFDAFAIGLLLRLAEFDHSQDVRNCAHEIGIAIVECVQLGGDVAGFDGGFRVIAVFEALQRPRQQHGWFGPRVVQEIPGDSGHQHHERPAGTNHGPLEGREEGPRLGDQARRRRRRGGLVAGRFALAGFCCWVDHGEVKWGAARVAATSRGERTTDRSARRSRGGDLFGSRRARAIRLQNSGNRVGDGRERGERGV